MVMKLAEVIECLEGVARDCDDGILHQITDSLFSESPVPLFEERLAEAIHTISLLELLQRRLHRNLGYLDAIADQCEKREDINFLLAASYCAAKANGVLSALRIFVRLKEVLESTRVMSDKESLYLNYHVAHYHEIAKFMVAPDVKGEYLLRAKEGYDKVVSLEVFGQLPAMKQACILDCLAYTGLATSSMEKQEVYETEQRALSLLRIEEIKTFFYTRHALAAVRIASLFIDPNLYHSTDNPRKEGFKYLKIALEHPRFEPSLSYAQQDFVARDLLSLYRSGDGDVVFGSSEYYDCVNQFACERVKQVLLNSFVAASSEEIRPATPAPAIKEEVLEPLRPIAEAGPGRG